jgi:hypothetical protein
MNGPNCVVETKAICAGYDVDLSTIAIHRTGIHRDMRRSDVVRQSIRHKAMSLRRGVVGQLRAATRIHNGLGVSCAGNEALCVHLCVALMAHGQAWLKIRYTAGASRVYR